MAKRGENQVRGAPGPGPGGFPVVGIGASAGGLAAFEAFFAGMPADADPGMAFVLVQHLAPD
jgi:two-component system, chemotaxis family, CheB/CheR fusion protein